MRAAPLPELVLPARSRAPAITGALCSVLIVVTNGDRLERIVEFKDATDEERAITLCNSGVLAADCATLLRLIEAVGNDNDGEGQKGAQEED